MMSKEYDSRLPDRLPADRLPGHEAQDSEAIQDIGSTYMEAYEKYIGAIYGYQHAPCDGTDYINLLCPIPQHSTKNLEEWRLHQKRDGWQVWFSVRNEKDFLNKVFSQLVAICKEDGVELSHDPVIFLPHEKLLHTQAIDADEESITFILHHRCHDGDWRDLFDKIEQALDAAKIQPGERLPHGIDSLRAATVYQDLVHPQPIPDRERYNFFSRRRIPLAENAAGLGQDGIYFIHPKDEPDHHTADPFREDAVRPLRINGESHPAEPAVAAVANPRVPPMDNNLGVILRRFAWSFIFYCAAAQLLYLHASRLSHDRLAPATPAPVVAKKAAPVQKASSPHPETGLSQAQSTQLGTLLRQLKQLKKKDGEVSAQRGLVPLLAQSDETYHSIMQCASPTPSVCQKTAAERRRISTYLGLVALADAEYYRVTNPFTRRLNYQVGIREICNSDNTHLSPNTHLSRAAAAAQGISGSGHLNKGGFLGKELLKRYYQGKFPYRQCSL